MALAINEKNLCKAGGLVAALSKLTSPGELEGNPDHFALLSSALNTLGSVPIQDHCLVNGLIKSWGNLTLR